MRPMTMSGKVKFAIFACLVFLGSQFFLSCSNDAGGNGSSDKGKAVAQEFQDKLNEVQGLKYGIVEKKDGEVTVAFWGDVSIMVGMSKSDVHLFLDRPTKSLEDGRLEKYVRRPFTMKLEYEDQAVARIEFTRTGY